MQGLTQGMDYELLFPTIWQFLDKYQLAIKTKVITEIEGIPIHTPEQLNLPFYFYQPEKGLQGKVEMGPKRLQQVLRLRPVGLNVYFTLVALTVGGRIGLCIKIQDLSQAAGTSDSYRSSEFLQELRKKRWLTWIYLDQRESHKYQRFPPPIIYLDRKGLLQ